MQRVLITGGNGFIGSHLVKMFLAKSYSVLVISRSSSSLTGLPIEFISHTSPGYSQYTDKVRSFAPTVVIHCAWDGGNSYKDSNSTRQISNISSGGELLDIVSALPEKPTFIGFGSFSEYGTLAARATETMVDCPLTLYGQTKSCFKSISRMVCEQNATRWVWVRPCYIYGPNDVETRLLPSLVRKFRTGEPIVLDACTTIIDYLHIDDFCKAIDTIIITSSTGVFNICSGNEYSVRSVVEEIKAMSSSSSELIFDQTRSRIGISSYICGSPERLKSIGWSPAIELSDGLRTLMR